MKKGYVDQLVSQPDMWCYIDIWPFFMNNIMKAGD